MLNLFGGRKPDHPLADAREAKKMFDALPAQDVQRALDDLSSWHETVAAAADLKIEQRIAIHIRIDDEAQPRVRKLAREYFGSERPSRFHENRLWTAVHGYWMQAGHAFAKSADLWQQQPKLTETERRHLVSALVRATRSLGQQLKWMYMRYGPVDHRAWGLINRIYSLAEARKRQDQTAPVVTGGSESSVRLEFNKALMLGASSADSLLPPEIEIAERIIGECSAGLILSELPGKEFSHWIDLDQAMSPLRLVKEPQLVPGLRCISGRPARDSLSAIEQKLRTGGSVSPAILANDDPETILPVVQHLIEVWSPEPPERRFPRHVVKSRLSVVAGFDKILNVLGGGDSLDFDTQQGESWIVENVSAGGFGTVVPQTKGDWLKVGVLVGLQPDGGSNWVIGLVRRVTRTAGQQARVGIETLSRTPLAVRLKAGRGDFLEPGVLLPIAGTPNAEVRVALKSGTFIAGQNLESDRDGLQRVYMPIAISDRGDDFEVARYREMLRES